MILVSKIYWFYRDNCCTIAPMSQLPTKLKDASFVDDILTDLFNTAARCLHDIAQLRDPEGFEVTVYDDLIDLHDRAVELYNLIMDRRGELI